MGKDPAFLFYPGDYLRDTQCFSEKTQVAYDRIICEHMRNICIAESQLKFFTKRLNEEEKDELMTALARVNGGFQIPWVAESIVKRRAYNESRRKNREKHMSNICETYDPHMENEIEIEREDGKAIKEKRAKSIYGEYKHVRLTDKEHASLKDKLGDKLDFWIKELDEGLELKGYKYKSHYLAILKWAGREVKAKAENNLTPAQKRTIESYKKWKERMDKEENEKRNL